MIESALKRVLRTVFGGGSDINAANPLQTYDPKPAKEQKKQDKQPVCPK